MGRCRQRQCLYFGLGSHWLLPPMHFCKGARQHQSLLFDAHLVIENKGRQPYCVIGALPHILAVPEGPANAEGQPRGTSIAGLAHMPQESFRFPLPTGPSMVLVANTNIVLKVAVQRCWVFHSRFCFINLCNEVSHALRRQLPSPLVKSYDVLLHSYRHLSTFKRTTVGWECMHEANRKA